MMKLDLKNTQNAVDVGQFPFSRETIRVLISSDWSCRPPLEIRNIQKPVAAFIRSLSIRVAFYLDDILL